MIARTGLSSDLDLGEVGFGLHFVPSTDTESDHASAYGETDADHERKHIGSDLLARHGWQARAAIGRQTAEGDHEQASHTAGELHALLGCYGDATIPGPASREPRTFLAQLLARPAAFMATPIALLPSSMNLAKPAPSAHFTPKPRLAMNSRNSAASLTFLSAAVIAVAMSAGSPLGAANPRQAPVV